AAATIGANPRAVRGLQAAGRDRLGALAGQAAAAVGREPEQARARALHRHAREHAVARLAGRAYVVLAVHVGAANAGARLADRIRDRDRKRRAVAAARPGRHTLSV